LQPTSSKAKLSSDVLAFDETELAQRLPKGFHARWWCWRLRAGLQIPITGITACCALTSIGHAAAAPP